MTLSDVWRSLIRFYWKNKLFNLFFQVRHAFISGLKLSWKINPAFKATPLLTLNISKTAADTAIVTMEGEYETAHKQMVQDRAIVTMAH